MITRIFVALVCGACMVALSHGQRNDYADEDQYNYEDPPPAPVHRSPHARTSISRPAPLEDSGPKPTPVPILKQINKHNEDGSYTYGYEGADGSFKIETKLPTGEVMGKYGYVDDQGKVRVVEYGANRYGFMPSGEGITVAPPTLVDESTDKNGNRIVEDYEDVPQARPAPRPSAKGSQHRHAAPRPAPPPVQFEPEYQEEQFVQPAPQPQRPVFAPAQRPSPPSYETIEQHFGPNPNRASFSGPQQSLPRPAAPARPRPAPIPVSLGPTPPRPQITGAFPVPNSAPAPVYEERPQPPRPAPARIPVPQRPSPSRSLGSSGILDQLAKDYALPSGGAGANVDISFSSY